MTRLFVIGNGFDMAHGLKTSFMDFKTYVINRIKKSEDDEEKEKVKDVYLILNLTEISYNLFYYTQESEVSNDWNHFENILAHIGTLNNENRFVKDDLFKDDLLKLDVLQDLLKIFTEWINSIEVSSNKYSNIFKNDDIFLNFNYTETLEKNYKSIIQTNNINHIHTIKDGTNQFYHYGHDRDFNEVIKSPKLNNRMVNLFGINTKKDVENIIKKEDQFFEELKSKEINEIYFWGFSLSEVDKLYIKKIIKDNTNTIEKVFLCKHQFEKNDREYYYDFLKNYNLENKLESFNDHLIDNKTMKPFKRFISAIVFCIFVYQGVRMILGLNEVVKSKNGSMN